MTNTPILLAIDTCTRRSSIAMRDAQVTRAEMSWETDRHHTAAVSKTIHTMMTQCGIAPEQIGAVAVALGPGSFTGVRCGLAIAKGMAVANENLALIGVNAFDVLIAAQPTTISAPIHTLIEAGRKRVALRTYHNDGSGNYIGARDFQLVANEALSALINNGKPAFVCGDVPVAFVPDVLTRVAAPASNMRRAAALADVAYARWCRGEVDNAQTLAPIYPPAT